MAVYRPNPVFLAEQLSSLIAQTCPDWRCVLVDDSGDAAEHAALLTAAAVDSRFLTMRHSVRCGSVKAFETGLSRTPFDTDYICYCDQDDIWMPEKLSISADFLAHSEALLVHSDLSTIDDAGTELDKSLFQKESRHLDHRLLYLLVKNVATGCTMAFRRSLLPALLPFPQLGNPPPYHHDLWTILHAAARGDIGAINQPLVRYRQHAGNQIGQREPPSPRLLPPPLLRNPLRYLASCRSRWQLHARIAADFLATITPPYSPEIDQVRLWLGSRYPPHTMRTLAREMNRRRDPAFVVAQEILLGKLAEGLLRRSMHRVLPSTRET
jgi:O-antigen biosynthesis protein